MSSKRGKFLGKSDFELWERVKKTATPLVREKQNSHVQDRLKTELKGSAVAAGAMQPSKPKPVSQQTPQLRITPPAPQSQYLEEGTWRKISKGRVSIDGRIDLHGMTHDQARRQLDQYLHTAKQSGFRTILVITGKGRLGEGVLRQALPHWLGQPNLRSLISGYREAHPLHGGSGAFYVRLRRERP